MSNSRGYLLNPVLLAIACISFFAILVFAMLPMSTEAKTKSYCFDTSVPLTLEEERITEGAPYPEQILKDSQFDRYVDKFEKQLCSAPNLKNAQNIVEKYGTQIWNDAVDRAQGKGGKGKLDNMMIVRYIGHGFP